MDLRPARMDFRESQQARAIAALAPNLNCQRKNAKHHPPHHPFAPAAERRVRTQRPAASNPSAERRRYKGVRRESKEGVGGTRNPPIPPWPPEAATRLLSQPNAAQGCDAMPTVQRKNAKHHTNPLQQGRAPRQNAAPRRLQPLAERRRCKWVKEAATWLLPQPKAAQECCRYDRTATEERRTTRTTLCNNGRAPRKNAPPCRLHPHSGAAAVQRGEKRIQGGSRGNSQSPYPSLAAGGSHMAAAAAISGARMPPHKPQGNGRTQSSIHHCPCGRAPRKNAPPCRLHPLSGAAAVQRGEKRIQGGSRGNSQSPYPSLAAGGCHMAAAAAKISARMLPRNQQGNGRTQSSKHHCPCGRAPRKNAPPCRLHPHSGAAAVQRGTRESKEGVGGTRNPPGPPWPPEAATR